MRDKIKERVAFTDTDVFDQMEKYCYHRQGWFIEDCHKC